MALPAIKATGNARTLVFSGDFTLQAKSRTCDVFLNFPPTAPYDYPGKDRNVFEINEGIGGNSSRTDLSVENLQFRITASFVQDWEHARPYATNASIVTNRPKFTLSLKVEILNTSGLLATVYNSSSVEYGTGYQESKEKTGSFSIEMDVIEVLRWKSFNVSTTSIPNPFDASPQWPSRYLIYEERFANAANNLRWDVSLGSLSTTGSRSFSALDPDSASILYFGPSDYGMTLGANAFGTVISGIPLQAKIENVVCANWTSFSHTGQVYNILTGAWEGGAGIFTETAKVSSDVAFWETVDPGDLVWSKVTNTTAGITYQFTGEGVYSQPSFNSGAGRYDFGFPTYTNRGQVAQTVRVSPPLKVRINGVAKQFSDPYLNAVRFFTNLKSDDYFYNAAGAFSKSFTLQERKVNAHSAVSSPSGSRASVYNQQAQISPFYCSLDAAHASSFGEDANDNRASFITKVVDIIEVESASEITHDDFGSTTGWAGTNATLGSSGTAVTITATGSSASATRTYSPKLNTETKRFLKLRVKLNSGPKTLYFKVNGGKKWSFVTGAANTWTDIEIDTMLPNVDQGSGSDHRDNRWPCASVSADEPTNEAKYQGVNRISTMEISGLGSGDVLDLDYLKGFTKSFEKLTILNSDLRTDFVSGYVSDGFDVKRGAIAITDGRTSLELWPNYKYLGSYLTRSIADFVADGDKFLGWNWTALSPNVLDSWTNTNIVAPEVGGGGWLWNGTTWVDYTNMTLSGLETLQATLYVDLIQFYPGIGNPFTDLNYDDYTAELQLYCSHIFRGQAHGIVWNSSFEPVGGALLVASETTGGAPAGSAISDSVGYFETIPPARPFRGLTISHIGSSIGSVSTGVYPRRQHRVGGIVTEPGFGNPWCLHSKIGQYHRVSVKDGDVWHHRASFSAPFGGFEKDGTVTASADCSHPRLVEDARNVLYLFYIRSGSGLYYRPSFDEGQTWGDETLLIASAYFATVATDPLGTILAFGFVYNSGTSGPGKIKMRRRGPGDSSFSSAVNVKSEGVDLQFEPDTFHVSYDNQGPGRWIAVWKISGETDVTEWESVDDGASFKQVT